MAKFVDITKCKMNVEICGFSMANHDQVKLAIQRNGLLKVMVTGLRGLQFGRYSYE